MKLIIGLLVASLALTSVLALPARSPNDDAEVIDLPRRRFTSQRESADDADIEPDFRDFKGVINTGVGGGYPFLQPVPHPFSGFGLFDSFEDIFRRLHTRLIPALPRTFGGAGIDGDSESNEGGSVFNINLSPNKGNTTSTVKVVDGHKIEVNETVYGSGDNLFKVRVVNIRPVDSGEDNGAGTIITSAPPTNNREDIEDNEDNEETREPLEKQANENEIRTGGGNIDGDAEVKY